MKRKRPLKPKFEAARDDAAQVPENPKSKKGGSYRDLTEKVGPVFDQARDWAAEQRQKLSDEQQRHFDELKKEREKEEKKRLKAIKATQERIARETDKRSRLNLELTPRNRRPNFSLVGLGKQLGRQRTELKQYQEKRQEIETKFLRKAEKNRAPKREAKEPAKKPVIRRARKRRSKDRDDDRSR